MKTSRTILTAFSLTLCLSEAATTFTGAVDSDISNAANWDNGVPAAGNDGTISGGLTGSLDSALSVGTATVTVGADGTEGTLNINAGGSYSTANGAVPAFVVGSGAGSVGTVNVSSGGNFSLLGASADLFIGDAAGGQGFVNILAGGNLDARKAVEIRNGKLSFAATSTYSGGRPQDELLVGSNGVLGFQTDGSTVLTIDSALNSLDLSAGSTLHMELGGSFSVGDTWTLIDGVSGFNGTFTEVINPVNASQSFTAYYGTGPAAADELVIELTAVPEPSSTALLGLGGLALILRRRKLMRGICFRSSSIL